MRAVDTAEVRELMDRGAQVVEVLTDEAFDAEHLPGAHNIPIASLLVRAPEELDPRQPTVVYCYDHECDLSSRGAAILAAIGFTDVYDYVTSKVAWMASGYPVEGTTPDSRRAGALARKIPTVGLDERVSDLHDRFGDDGLVVVVDGDNTILGVVRAETLTLPPETPVREVIRTDPPSVRPSITAAALAKSMTEDARSFVLVSTLDGDLLGVITRDDLHGQH